MLENFTCNIAFETSADFTDRLALDRAPLDIIDGRLVPSHSNDCYPVKGGVGAEVSASVEPVRIVFPLDAEIGQTPQSFAKAASERMRFGLSPSTTSISVTVPVEMPGASISVGAQRRARVSRALPDQSASYPAAAK